MAAKFSLKNSPGRGRGLFTGVAIAPGDSIHANEALFAISNGTPISICQAVRDLSHSARQQQFNALSHAASDHTLRAYYVELGQSNRVGEQGDQRFVMPGLRWRGANQSAVYNNNNFKIRNASDTIDMAGIFMTAARLNHSCIPNCCAAWNPASKQLCVRAIRQLGAGEELFICYDEEELFLTKRTYRIEKLQERWV
jgi:hypothetical protein